MKISKEKFLKYIEQIKQHDEVESFIFSILSEDIANKVSTMASNYVDMLEECCDDQHGWISYWLYELEFGEKWVESSVTMDGTNIPLKTAEDLWNLLEIDYCKNHI